MNQNILNAFKLIDEKVINPLIKASGFTEEQGRVFKGALSKLIFAQTLVAVGRTVVEEEARKLKEEIDKQLTEENKVIAFQKFIKNSPKSQEALASYLEKDLPDFIGEIVAAFTKSATEEQKKEFLKLSK